MTRTILALLSALLLTVGCSSANAACPGGNCSLGVWSPWGGAWYYASPCASGKCRTAAKPTEPEEPVAAVEEQQADAAANEPAPETACPASDFKPFCLRVAELINAQRAANGLPALHLDLSLCAGCDRHSSWMRSGGGFQHAYYAGARECIAYGVRTPEAVVGMWLNSSGHRAIILGGGKTLGVGCSGSFWTLRVR